MRCLIDLISIDLIYLFMLEIQSGSCGFSAIVRQVSDNKNKVNNI